MRGATCVVQRRLASEVTRVQLLQPPQSRQRAKNFFLQARSITPATPVCFRPLKPIHNLLSRRRNFQSSTICLKKGGNKVSKQGAPEEPAVRPKSVEDPFDFSELSEAIQKAHTVLKDGLSKLRAGGRFNPEVVENLRVSLEKGTKETVRLGDLAQCVPRGRVLNVMAGEKQHVKAISSAILSGDLNLVPQSDAENPLQLNIQLPPPTTESRKQAVKTAGDLSERASGAVRNARATQQKKLRAMQQQKTIRPDDLKKATDKMEKVVAEGSAEVKKIVDSAKKMLESG